MITNADVLDLEKTHYVPNLRRAYKTPMGLILRISFIALAALAAGCQLERPLVAGSNPLYERDIPSPCVHRTITIQRQHHFSPKGGPYTTGTVIVRCDGNIILRWDLGILH